MKVWVKVTATTEIQAPDQDTAMTIISNAIEDALDHLGEVGVDIPMFSLETESKQLFDA